MNKIITNIIETSKSGILYTLNFFREATFTAGKDIKNGISGIFQTETKKLTLKDNLKLYASSFKEIISTALSNKKIFSIIAVLLTYLFLQDSIANTLIESENEKIASAFNVFGLVFNGIFLVMILAALINFEQVKIKGKSFFPARKFSFYVLLLITMALGFILSSLTIKGIGMIVPYELIVITEDGQHIFDEFSKAIYSSTLNIALFVSLLITAFFSIIAMFIFIISTMKSVINHKNGFFKSIYSVIRLMFKNLPVVLFNSVFIVIVLTVIDFVSALYSDSELITTVITMPLIFVSYLFYGNYISKVSNLLLPTTKKEK